MDVFTMDQGPTSQGMIRRPARLQLPSAPAAQQQLEKLTEENRRLHDQLTQWQNYYAAQLAACAQAELQRLQQESSRGRRSRPAAAGN